MENTEKLIVEQLKNGNEDAYKYIYDYHYVLLCHVANQYLNDNFLSETIVGDVIFHLWEIRETLNITISIRSYLIKAVRNRCIDYLKSGSEKKEISFSVLVPEEMSEEKYLQSDNYPLGILLERELEHEIRMAIDKLPIECRCVFEKSRFEEKKYEEDSFLRPRFCHDNGSHVYGICGYRKFYRQGDLRRKLSGCFYRCPQQNK